MKKALAIIAIAIYFLGATDAYQLLKLPLFVKHFRIHQQQDPSLSLAGFIKIHYLDTPVVDDDFAQDMELPFKTHDQDGCTLSAISMPVNRVSIEHPELPVSPEKKYVFAVNHYRFNLQRNVFQPPRVS